MTFPEILGAAFVAHIILSIVVTGMIMKHRGTGGDFWDDLRHAVAHGFCPGFNIVVGVMIIFALIDQRAARPK